MEDNDYRVKLPKKVVESLDLENDCKATLHIQEQKIIIEPASKDLNNKVISAKWYLIPAALVSIAYILFFVKNTNGQIPLVGEFSLATSAIILGFISGIGCFSFFFIRGKNNKINTSSKYIYWRNFPTVMASFIIILFFVLNVFFWVMGMVFKGVSFDLLTSLFIFYLLVCIINYYMIYASLTITTDRLINVLLGVIIGGVFAAMITNSEQQWWQYNLSFLGTTQATGSWQFNLTLIVSGLLLIALVDFIFVSLYKKFPRNKKLTILHILLILVALSLAAIGLFPNNEVPLFKTIHNRVANLSVLLIIVLIITVKWLLPKITKEFLNLSYIIGASLIVIYVLFQPIGYLSLTAFEIISFILAFMWLFLLFQNLQRISQNTDISLEISIQHEE